MLVNQPVYLPGKRDIIRSKLWKINSMFAFNSVSFTSKIISHNFPTTHNVKGRLLNKQLLFPTLSIVVYEYVMPLEVLLQYYNVSKYLIFFFNTSH